jgi:hypothetical protein
MRLGDVQTQTFIAGISGVNVSGVPVLISSSGQLGIASSSRRFKTDIEDMGDSTNNLMRLRPVTYRYKQPFEDGSQPLQYGLIAEEVADIYPELVARSARHDRDTEEYDCRAGAKDPVARRASLQAGVNARTEAVALSNAGVKYRPLPQYPACGGPTPGTNAQNTGVASEYVTAWMRARLRIRSCAYRSCTG